MNNEEDRRQICKSVFSAAYSGPSEMPEEISGEYALVWGIIFRAVLDAVGNTGFTGGNPRIAVRTARAWIMADDFQEFFGFRNLASLLDINVDHVRNFVRRHEGKNDFVVTGLSYRTMFERFVRR